MITRRILITTLLLTLTQTLRSQTADDYVSQGRAFLAVTNMAAANTCFSNAVAKSPGHQVGNVRLQRHDALRPVHELHHLVPVEMLG